MSSCGAGVETGLGLCQVRESSTLERWMARACAWETPSMTLWYGSFYVSRALYLHRLVVEGPPAVI